MVVNRNETNHTTRGGNVNSEERLTVRKISMIADSVLDPSVSGILTNLGYVIRIEFGISDNAVVGVFDTTGKKVSTYEDFKKMTSIRGMLMRSLESRQRDSIRSVAELALATKEKGAAKKLMPSELKRISCLNPWIKNLNLVIKALEEIDDSFKSSNRFMAAFVALADNYGEVLSVMFDTVRNVSARSNASEELYRLMKVRGIPEWFHKVVILKVNDFKVKINQENPYKMFFSSQGIGGITLLTEELLDKTFLGRFVGLVKTVYDGSVLLESLVDGMEAQSTDMVAGGFSPADSSERDAFKSFKWSLLINLKPEEVRGFFDAKARNHSCPMMPYNSALYTERLTRVNIALVRASQLEGPDSDSTVNLFCEVFDSGKTLILSSKRANLFEVTQQVDGYEDIFSAYTLGSKAKLADTHRSLVGRLASTSIFQEKRGSLATALTINTALVLDKEQYSETAKLLYSATEDKSEKTTIAKGPDDVQGKIWKHDTLAKLNAALAKKAGILSASSKKKYSSSYYLRNEAYREVCFNVKGLSHFKKDGEYYVPSDAKDKEAIKKIEDFAKNFQIKETEDDEVAYVGTHIIHSDIEKRIKGSKIKSKLPKKLFDSVFKLLKCFKRIEMQEYVIDTVIATYQEFKTGNLVSTEEDES